MSHPAAAQHGHDHGAHDHAESPVHFTMGGYVAGFVLSVILTAIPFWLIMNNVIANSSMAAFAILAFAVVQMFVHMVFFLHMNAQSEGGWNLLALIFTLVLLVILLAGSLWVMHNMNVNMMPMPAAMQHAS